MACGSPKMCTGPLESLSALFRPFSSGSMVSGREGGVEIYPASKHDCEIIIEMETAVTTHLTGCYNTAGCMSPPSSPICSCASACCASPGLASEPCPASYGEPFSLHQISANPAVVPSFNSCWHVKSCCLPLEQLFVYALDCASQNEIRFQRGHKYRVNFHEAKKRKILPRDDIRLTRDTGYKGVRLAQQS